MAIGSCSVLKKNQSPGSRAARAYGNRARQNGRSHLAIYAPVSPKELRFFFSGAIRSYPARQVRSTRSVSQGTEFTTVTEYWGEEVYLGLAKDLPNSLNRLRMECTLLWGDIAPR